MVSERGGIIVGDLNDDGLMDFIEFQVAKADGSVSKLFIFSMILGYSRKMYAELIERCDLPSFLDCHIRAFEYFGGVPEQILYDRMKNVYIGKIAGKKKFNDTLTGFALHYDFKPEVASRNAMKGFTVMTGYLRSVRSGLYAKNYPVFPSLCVK